MITRRRRLNLFLSLIVIFSMISASAGQASSASDPSPDTPTLPELAPPPGRNGLGLGQAENGNPADAPVHLVDGVNVANGNLLFADLHIQINTVGPPFGLQIVYNSQASAALDTFTPLGRKWTHNLNWYVTLDGSNNLAVHKGDGEIITLPLSCRQDVNRSGGPIDVLDVQLDAEAWNTALGEPGYDPIFDVALPLNDRVDIRDVQVVSASFNLQCSQVANSYWLWNEALADAVYSQAVRLPSDEIELHTREGIVYRFFAPAPAGPTAGKLQSITDRSGSNIALAYTPTGLLQTATASAGASLQFSYNLSACAVPVISQVVDHTGRIVSYQYGGDCNLIGVQRYGAPWRSFGYLTGSRLASATDALGNATSYSYDASQRVTALQLPGAPAQTYNYSTPGATVITDPIGRVTRYQYTPNSKISQVQQIDSGLLVAYLYDARGNLAHLGGANGNSYQYDTAGNLVRIETAHPDPLNPARPETLFSYDACNQVATTTDALGRVTTNSYDPATCHLVSSSDPLGNTTTFVNNARGQPTLITDALGRQTQNTYDDAGNLIETSDHAGNATLMAYDPLNRKLSETDPAGAVTAFGYDAFDRQTTITAPNGGVTTMVYDALGNLLSATNPDDRTTAYAYDARGNKIAVTDASGTVTAYAYDAADRLVQVTDPLGQVTQIQYDPMDRPVEVRANALSTSPQVTTLAYDDAAMQRRITNARGQTTTFHMDQADNVVRVVNPDGSQIQYQYNLAGELVAVIDALGRTETTAYDAVGRKIAETDALGNTTHYVYDALGNVTQVINAKGEATSFGYDHQDRMTQVVDPLGGVTAMAYDARGNATAVTNADGQTTTFQYDANGNISQVANPLGQTTLLEHSLAGVPTALQSPRGLRVQFTLDSLGRVAVETKTGPGGLTASTSFTYDAAGNRTHMTDANGGVWQYGYDDMGRLARTADPLGNMTTYRYDALGNLTQKQLPGGVCTVDYSYDPLNRLVRTDYSNGSYTLQTYDAMGNVTQVAAHGSGAAGVVSSASFAYDARNRVVGLSGTITPTLTYNIAYSYDSLGNPVQKSYTLPGASPIQVAQTWDANNRLTNIARSQGGQTASVAKSYTPGGRLSSAAASSNAGTAAFTSYQYDAAGRVTQIQHCTSPACTTVLSRFVYTYDADGNRTGEQVLKDGVLTQIQTDVDGLGRLAHELRLPLNPPGPPAYDTFYTYDAVGNRQSSHDVVSNRTTQTSYDAAHRTAEVTESVGPLPVRGLVYQYDAAGNLAQRQSTFAQLPAQPVSEQFQYDCEGQLVGYQDLLNGQQETTLYDGLGNKIVTAGTAGGKAYVYDGPNVAAEYNRPTPATPTLAATYLFGQEIDEPLARIDAATLTPAFFLKDALGSTRQVVDQVSAVQNDYEYRAFGELWTQVTGLPNDILFTGRQLDPVSQLYDFRTRAYDPTDGRFLQPDPIYQGLILAPCVGCWQNPLELMEVMPLYAYVGNNPSTYTDPTGEQWWFWHPWWWVSSAAWFYQPYGWWGWWYGPWGWAGLRWWWWRWWWPANPWWGGWWWWNWRWWWGGWWFGWWGNIWWPWWLWNWHWWWWPWWTGWGWWWYPWWWGGWYWPWWWFRWRGWWHWWWRWPFKWGWWCGWWWRWWWPWWWRGWWWPWGWLNWAGWRLPFWLGWGWWWWPWWWGGFWWPWWFGWGWWPWWGGWWWWNWWWPWWRPWYWGLWWWGPWHWWSGWYWWPRWWGRFWWPRWWWCRWSLRPWWWWNWWVWQRWWRPWWQRWWWWPYWRWWPWWWQWWPWSQLPVPRTAPAAAVMARGP